jgi:O-antigen ligase
VTAAAVIFVATCMAAQTTSIIAVDVLMIGACANAALVILQELKIWTPFVQPPGIAGSHYGSVAFMGNANDVGSFLAAPALAAVVLAVTASGRRRWAYVAISVLLVAGLAASATRTAILALVAGLIVFALARSRRAALVTASVAAVFVLLALIPSTSINLRTREFADAVKSRDYQRLFSERLLPILAAADMTRDHPLLGTGPGCFRYHFMAYRVALNDRYPKEWTRGWPGNWSAAHNDHLQVAAEAGLPGYLLFLAAIGVGGGMIGKNRIAAPTTKATFARALRLPLAALVFVLCLAQFPLELAAPRLMLITLGALCITWDGDDAV